MYQNHKCEFGLLIYNSPASCFITTHLRLAIHNNGTTLTSGLHRDSYQVMYIELHGIVGWEKHSNSEKFEDEAGAFTPSQH